METLEKRLPETNATDCIFYIFSEHAKKMKKNAHSPLYLGEYGFIYDALPLGRSSVCVSPAVFRFTDGTP